MLIYQRWKHSCFLYLGSIIVDEFGLVASCQPGLVTMVHVSQLYCDCLIRYESNVCVCCCVHVLCALCIYAYVLCACIVCCAFIYLFVCVRKRGEGD